MGGPGAEPSCRRKNFGNLQKFPLKIAKMHYFCLFYTKFYKPCVNFSRFWTKTTNCWKSFEKTLKILDENSIEKLTFKLFLGMLMLKIVPSEIISFFDNHFFLISGVERSRCSSPWLRHCFRYHSLNLGCEQRCF